MIDRTVLKDKFVERFGREPRFFRAPGRVNLIGEHTDYNGGFVLPMAIERATTVAIAARSDRRIRVFAVNLEETAEIDLDEEKSREKGFWMNFIEGMARILERRNFKVKGADLLIWSDVPSGAGLSSSAALETAVGLALSEISGAKVDRTTLAQIGQQTEHEFVGAKVGIMDQFVSANAKKGHALLLDCRSLEFENVPLETKNAAIVMCDTKVKHDLATSEYNTRRRECEQAVEILKKFLPDIEQLRDVGAAEFEKYESELPEPIRRRARHVVTENARTLKAVEFLKQNDFEDFGKLMRQSHESLKTDYQVSCRELDLLVEIAEKCEGVFGARMTGGGFGGSTVNLVKRENLEDFKAKISAEYKLETGVAPGILVSNAAEGASEVF
jgi:galactokinase